MKDLDAGLAAHLAGGVTTLCWCWRIERRDGIVQGFTDHDRDVTFDGLTYEAASGFTATDMRDEVGLSVDNLEVSGALSSQSLEEAALQNGYYDDADVQIFRVNWMVPVQRVLMRSGSLGEVRRTGLNFTAEVRGLAHYLQQPSGRLYQYACDADLGDGRCKVVLDQAAYRATAIVAASDDSLRFGVTGLAAFSPGFFARGRVTVSDGPHASAMREIKSHVRRNDVDWLTMWTALAEPLDTGTHVVVTAGCDKRLKTCRDTFANVANFRGFPHIPGNEILTRVGRRD